LVLRWAILAGMKARTTTDKDRVEAVLLAVEAEVLGIAIESMTDDKNVAALAPVAA
jgi:hypothetical protein